METYVQRRARLLEMLPDRSLVIVAGGGLSPRNSDVTHPFRQDSNFQFLTGFVEPDAYLLMMRSGAESESVLLVQPRDPKMELWTGRRVGPERVVERYGVDRGAGNTDLDSILGEMLPKAQHIAYELGSNGELDQRIIKLARRHWVQPRRFFDGPNTWLDLSATLTDLRLIKDRSDIELIRRSVIAAAEGHTLGMRAARPGMREYQLQAAIEFGFRANGGIGSAYNSIVAGGDNANILHYDTNRDVLKDGDLVLVDAGCEIDCMASDITRTFPVNGTFSAAQAELYDVVLAAQLACLEASKPGGNTEHLHKTAVEVLSQGIHDIGLIEESVDTIIGEELYKKYYMHRTGHWLGLDVHDVGRYYADGSPRNFEPGMVFTVEPGLYVAQSAVDAPERFRGIGIRIEDDILITSEGHENLSASCPKSREDIEKVAKDRFDFHFPVVA